LRGPGAYASYLNHIGKYVEVIHAAVSRELQATVEHPRREIEHRGGLGVGEPDPAEIRVSGGGNAVRGDGSFAQVDHSLVNGVRRFRREQLISDRTREVREAIGDRRASTNRGSANDLDERAKRAVTAYNRTCSIVWCERKRHALTIADTYDITRTNTVRITHSCATWRTQTCDAFSVFVLRKIKRCIDKRVRDGGNFLCDQQHRWNVIRSGGVSTDRRFRSEERSS
jgi:hypothetical protein